ncbi:MAG TPA: D-alanyl-D-alanine carboxypeptidase/D-alanyl-D-alanine-endopeptidase [Acidimicrobiales bacterium]|nr:D-alanyl-D-alanine carboxypeptidase/D-alanyl-D-alanine-endopeptidase [Acidimicrobiales bacterium]
MSSRTGLRVRAVVLVVSISLLAAACDSDSKSKAAPTTTAPAATSVAASGLPDEIKAVMSKPRYKDATWSLLATDVKTGESFYPLNADLMSFTGSTRKLFSVGSALNGLGADHRNTTPVYRTGTVDEQGKLTGNLVLVGQGDLTFGGRRIDANTIEVTNFDHGDANNLDGTAQLTPQDPLVGIEQLAAQVKASGITTVDGDVAVDDRFFKPYRVPNQNLLITPVMVNENQVDVTITPTQPGQPATVEYRPKTAAFAVESSITTGPPGSPNTVEVSAKGQAECLGQAGCKGMISGSIPQDFKAPLGGYSTMVHTFRIDEPNSFARTAFIEALQRKGVTVSAAPVTPNPTAVLPVSPTYTDDTKVAAFESVPFAQHAKLILHVSLNLGANLSLSLFGESKDQDTIQGALANERTTLIDQYGVKGNQFDFPTNGSGSPDSQAAPRALVQMLTKMGSTPVAADYEAALPVLGVSGSMASTAVNLPAKGHVFPKPGSTVIPAPDGKSADLKAQNLSGYIETKSGRRLAYAVMVNNAGSLSLDAIASGIGEVFEDEGVISNYLYENL